MLKKLKEWLAVVAVTLLATGATDNNLDLLIDFVEHHLW